MEEKSTTASPKAEFIADLIGDNFLRIAKGLQELQDEKPDIFLEVAGLAGLSERKAYALSRLARQFGDLPEGRLYKIGWTKLQIIGRYLTDENRERLLELAGQHTAHDLEVILRGEEPVEDAKVVRFYLALSDHTRLRAALLKHGAVVSGNGLANVEPALMALVDKVETAT